MPARLDHWSVGLSVRAANALCLAGFNSKHSVYEYFADNDCIQIYKIGEKLEHEIRMWLKSEPPTFSDVGARFGIVCEGERLTPEILEKFLERNL